MWTPCNPSSTTSPASPTAPASHLETTVSSQNNRFKLCFRADFLSAVTVAILGFYYFTTLVIHESSMFRSAPSWPEPDLRQYKVLHSCLHAMKAWLDRFFLTPLAMYASMPTSIYSQLFYVMVCLHKTTASWDAAWVREIVDLVATLDRVIDTFEQLRAANSIMPPDEADDEGLSLGVRKFQALKIAWQTEVASRASADHAMQEGELLDDSQGLFTAFPMDYFGFNMLPDIFNNVSE